MTLSQLQTVCICRVFQDFGQGGQNQIKWDDGGARNFNEFSIKPIQK